MAKICTVHGFNVKHKKPIRRQCYADCLDLVTKKDWKQGFMYAMHRASHEIIKDPYITGFDYNEWPELQFMRANLSPDIHGATNGVLVLFLLFAIELCDKENITYNFKPGKSTNNP